MTKTYRMRVLALVLATAAGLCVSFSGAAETHATGFPKLEAEVLHAPKASPKARKQSVDQASTSVNDAMLPMDVTGWVARLRNAAQQQNYTGTLIVMTDAGHVAGSRVWHACQENQQIERVDVLDGPAKTVFRRGAEMRTFLYASRTVQEASVNASSVFPKLPPAQADRLDAIYSAHRKGVERVAGHEADVIWLVPKDGLRFGYRIWSERKSGLVLRVQTVQGDGRILEQASFLQIDLTTPVSFEGMSAAMDDVAGYEVVPATPQDGEATAGAWRLSSEVPGFALQGCRTPGTRANTVQCNYADGLTSVSVFVESLAEGAAPHAAAGWAAGATRAIAKPLNARTWLTVVGEVPAATLVIFADRLVRVER